MKVHIEEFDKKNFDRLSRFLAECDGRGTLMVMAVGHDDGCPSEKSQLGLAGELPDTCTCSLVDIHVEPFSPPETHPPNGRSQDADAHTHKSGDTPGGSG